MGLFEDIAGLGEDIGKDFLGATEAEGRRIFRRVLKPTGKGIWRGMREYDERVLDPLGAFAVQSGAELNKQTFVFDFERLSQGKQPLVHGRRTFFDEEITPRRIDYSKIAFGSGAARRREQEKVRATFEEAGPIGEILAKSAVDPFNIFMVKQGVVAPTYQGVRSLVRGGRRILPGGRAAVPARAQLLEENRALKTLVQEGRATPEQEVRLAEVRQQLAAAPEAARMEPPVGGTEAQREAVLAIRQRYQAQRVKLFEADDVEGLAKLDAKRAAEEGRVSLVMRKQNELNAERFRLQDERLDAVGRGDTRAAERLNKEIQRVDWELEDLAPQADYIAGGAGGPRVSGVEPPVGMDIDPVTGIDDALRQVPGNPGAAATKLSTLNETVPNLTEMAQTIMAEQAREGGILSNRLGRPFRFVTNRFVGSANTAKAETLDARVPLEAAKFESFGRGADEAAVLVDRQAEALGLATKFDDELVRLKSGQQATMRQVMEEPGLFKLTPEEAALPDAMSDQIKNLHNLGVRSLESHFMDEGLTARAAAARAAEILPETPLSRGQRYWPRMAAAVAEEDIALQRPNFFRVGAKAPNLQLPRTAEATGAVIRHSGDPGAVLSRYAQQVFFKIQQETVIKPMLSRLGIKPNQLVPTGMQAAVDGFRSRQTWIKQTQTLLGQVKGLSAGQLRNRVATLVGKDVPEEWRALVRQLEIDTLTPTQVGGRARTAAREAARAFEPEIPRAGLGKAAEAEIAAARADVAAAQFRASVPDIRKVLKVLAAQTADDLNEATRQLKAVQRVLQRGEGLRRLPEHKFPGITELFERTQAEAIEQAFDRLNPQSVPRFAAAINNWVGIGVGVQAGTADIGHVSLQMLQAWSLDPLALPGMLVRMTNNRAYLAQMTRLQRETFRDGRPMFETFLKYNGRLVSEPLMPDVMTIQAGTVTGKVAKFVTNWPVNRSFTRGINLGRMTWWKRAVQLTEKFKGRALTPDEYRAVMQTGNTITGDLDWTRAGVGQTQRAIERIGLRFAPSWLRAMLNMVGTAAYPSLGIEQNLARLALGTTIGTGVLIYTLVGQAIGQKPNFNPMDVGKFMTYRVKIPGPVGGDVRIGPGGVLVQLVRTAGKAAVLAEKAATADTPEEREAALRDLTDIREGKNPIRQFWRAGAPVIGGLIYDMTAGGGVHSYTQRPLSPTPEGALGFAESALPFAVQPALPMIPGYPGAQETEGVAGLLSTVLGGRSFPTSPSEIFIEMADERAQGEGFRAWEDVPKATKADIMRKSPELQAAQAEREKFFDKFPSAQSREDWTYAEIDKSRSLTEDTLLAMWGGVEDGTRDVSEFRRAFSDLMGKHAYHSSRLMDGLDTDMKRRKSETLQDYYARLYYAIQPEAFDGQATPGDFPDSQISPAEWEMWRNQRTGFWDEFAEAQQFRSYIETEYPARNWNSPKMAELHQMKNRMNQDYQEFLDVPLYRGLSMEAGNFIDSVKGLADRKSREIRFALAQRGVDISKVSVPARLAWKLVLQDIQAAGLTPEQMEWLKVAILMDLKPDLRQKLLSPERARYLLDHREMAQWYPSAYGDAGLGDREIALLGLAQAPMGTSVPERFAAATV